MVEFDLSKITGREPPIETDEDMMNALADALGDADALRTERDALRAEVERLEEARDGALLMDRDTLLVQSAALRARVAELEERLDAMIPLFEEARDALPAITLESAKLRGNVFQPKETRDDERNSRFNQ